MTKQEIYQGSLSYFEGDDLAANIWIDKYALQKTKGDFVEKTPDDMFRRMSKELARIERKYKSFWKKTKCYTEEEIYEFLKGFKHFVFGGSIMNGLGNPYQITSLSNCFAIGGEADTYGGICRMDEELLQVMKRRGGSACSVDFLRPNGAKISGGGVTSSGAVSFINRFSNSVKEVGLNGRRGAALVLMNVKHPDILDFINLKTDLTTCTGVNISVQFTDDFMDAVQKGSDYLLRFPIDLDVREFDISAFELNKLTPVGDKCYIRRVNAKEIFDKFVENNRKYAEPGSQFIDTIIEEGVGKGYGNRWREVLANACSEIPMPPYNSCILGSINLSNHIVRPFAKDSKINWGMLGDTIRMAVRLMDDIIDLELEKIEKIMISIEKKQYGDNVLFVEYKLWQKIFDNIRLGRRVGIGVIGFTDMLAKLGLYFTDQLEIENLFAFINHVAYDESKLLAKERGVFPLYDESCELHNRYFKRHPDNKGKRRNIALLSIAPTGTISIVARTTSGTEPLFSMRYKRRVKVESGGYDFIDESNQKFKEYYVVHKGLKDWLAETYPGVSIDDFTNESFKSRVENLPANPYHSLTAYNLSPLDKAIVQSKIQKYICHAISVTYNLPKTATCEEIYNLYMSAWEMKLKGMTVYVDGSREGILINDIKNERPEFLPCDIIESDIKGKKYCVVVGMNNGKLWEVFAFPKNKKDLSKVKYIQRVKSKVYDLLDEDKNVIIYDIVKLSESESDEFQTIRLSMELRNGIPLEEIFECFSKGYTITSFQRGVMRSLKDYLPETLSLKCSQCGGLLTKEGGCIICKNCGDSKCL